MSKSERLKKITESWIYPLALFILPLLTVNQGVDVSDSTYSLGNYLFADKLDGMWVISTYLSNLIGSAVVRLPGGGRLLWANVYTGIILSAIGILVYFSLKKEFESAHVFIGECIALCLCWIPTGILYNYVSYLLMAVGGVLLFWAVKKDSWLMMFVAGLVLGMNVFARIPNVTQMAFIFMLWVYAIYAGMKFKDVALRTGICAGGYAVGVGTMLLVVILQYGINGIVDMVNGLAGITSTDATYTPASMIIGTLKAYVRSSKWVVLVAVVVAGGIVLYRILPEKFTALKTVIYLAVIAVMIRFFWGRGMFSFRYYEDYSSMYEWGMLALYLSIIVDIYALVWRGKEKSDYVLLAVMSLVTIMIAPLGSNNYTYQNLNNMFLVMPVTAILGFDAVAVLANKAKKWINIPVAIMFVALMVCILVQSFGFNLKFVFRDGMRGEQRDTAIAGIDSLRGMYTNSEHARNLEGLANCVQINQSESIILYGNCPGLTYILNKPSALFSSWADLDSNPLELVKADLDRIAVENDYPVVIMGKGEGTAVNYYDKYDLIMNFIDCNEYSLVYDNSEFTVYAH